MQRGLQAFVLPETLALNNAEQSCWGCRPHSACVCPCTRVRKGGEVWGAPYGGYPWHLQSLSCWSSPVQSLVLLCHSCSNWVQRPFVSAQVF